MVITFILHFKHNAPKQTESYHHQFKSKRICTHDIISYMDNDIPKVLISYTHDSSVHKARVLGLSERLRSEGVDCEIDQYHLSPPEGWPRWMMNELQNADFVLVVCTE